MKYHIPAVIFAGGQSKRMGEDKALLPFNGHTTLTRYQYERLHTFFESLYISTKSPKFDFDATLIIDQYKESSPLVGLISVFEILNTESVFVLSVDAPFVGLQIIHTIIDADTTGTYDAVIAENFGKPQPLCGLYHRSILPSAKEAYRNNHHKMQILLKEVRTCYVPFQEEKSFLNMNHPHEYEKALDIISS
jgi:molybdopterin-guanine dinucleotide biosynthesis protein A